MPSQCGAIGCSNKVDADAKQRGITFHKVPSNPERRAIWKKALRRDFVITKYTVICSAHFEEKDMDRTGQTTRLREGVVPSIFNFPDKEENQPRRSKRKKTKTKRGRKNKVGKGTPNKKFTPKIYLPEEPTKAQKARKSIRGSRGGVKLEAIETALTASQPAAPESPAPPDAPPIFSAENDFYKRLLLASVMWNYPKECPTACGALLSRRLQPYQIP
ncbi:THAP domain-containing protein 2-like isoform X2 [Boleophthalmus pectinirostris]|uniref:THAP domain-containing protein 2-like isoform X2 n=1 Tax=Boleophthalmus pectinirostris TaxID=150288 RepID=UPI00242F3473|nr:THAP domain-containing protein 2-like isoform X2 [Boleophthalmus pectinirostris]